MTKFLMSLTVFAVGLPVFSQDTTDVKITSTGEELQLITYSDPFQSIDNSAVKREASFPDGHQKCMLYINKAFKFSDDVLAQAPVNIKMVAKFVVEKDGTLTNIQVERDARFDTGKQLIRILAAMPKWNPARDKDENPVRSQFVLPVSLYVSKG